MHAALIETRLRRDPRHSKSEWKPSSLIDSGTAPDSVKGARFSLPPWKDAAAAAALANNKVSFFFRPCCRHSIMHCPFNGALCAALALMQRIHPPLPWSERRSLCVRVHFNLWEITCCVFTSVGMSYVKKKKKIETKRLLFFDRPRTLPPPTRLHFSNIVCCAGELFAKRGVALGTRVPASEIHQGCAEGHDLIHKHGDSRGAKKKKKKKKKKKGRPAFASTFMKRLSCDSLLMLYSDARMSAFAWR